MYLSLMLNLVNYHTGYQRQKSTVADIISNRYTSREGNTRSELSSCDSFDRLDAPDRLTLHPIGIRICSLSSKSIILIVILFSFGLKEWLPPMISKLKSYQPLLEIIILLQPMAQMVLDLCWKVDR